MTHLALPRFWKLYRRLPKDIQKLADKNFLLLKADPSHPSLHFKKISQSRGVWSARVGISYRALATERPDGMTWFWIGPHAEYDKLLS